MSTIIRSIIFFLLIESLTLTHALYIHPTYNARIKSTNSVKLRFGFKNYVLCAIDGGAPDNNNDISIAKNSKRGDINMDEIERLGIQIGDEIEVCRAGDVIPKIIRVVKINSFRTKITCDKCPACGGKVHQSGPFLRCSSWQE